MNKYIELMRLNKPIPILLLLYPTWWALLGAGNFQNLFYYFIIFSLGVVIMRTVGCIVNDIADREFDKNVKRTMNRPITSGLISVKSAILLSLSLCCFALVLVLFLNMYTIILSFVALFLAILYPFSKRFLPVPQIILGLAYNFGIIMAYSAILNKVTISAYILYIATIFWTLAYDTIYAISDLPYDKKIGLKSSAVFFEKKLFISIISFQISFLITLCIFGMINDYSFLFYIGLFVVVILFYLQYLKYKSKKIADCIKAFSDNHWIGLYVLILIIFNLS